MANRPCRRPRPPHKTRLELRLARARGLRQSWIDAGYRHARVLTGKGYFLLAGALGALTLALSAHWAQFGVMSVLGLTLVYLVVTVGLAVSAFYVRGEIGNAPAWRRGTIVRELSPAVASRGDPVEDRFHLERAAVPFGFHLLLTDDLPPRLRSASRHVADHGVSSRLVTLASPLACTPRGLYAVGPAQIWYQDIFGITRIAVAQAASASLKVLPRFRAVVLEELPRASGSDEDVLTVLARRPQEDYFRFREYQSWDETRRIHWKLSLKLGRLQVRAPESVPISRREVLLVLDSYLPPEFEESREPIEGILDRLVESWISLAKELAQRGERVSLVSAACTEPAGPVVPTELACGSSTPQIWAELGSRVRWQSEHDLDALLRAANAAAAGTPARAAVVVTARFVPLPPGRHEVTWVLCPAEVETLDVDVVDRSSGSTGDPEAPTAVATAEDLAIRAIRAPSSTLVATSLSHGSGRERSAAESAALAWTATPRPCVRGDADAGPAGFRVGGRRAEAEQPAAVSGRDSGLDCGANAARVAPDQRRPRGRRERRRGDIVTGMRAKRRTMAAAPPNPFRQSLSLARGVLGAFWLLSIGGLLALMVVFYMLLSRFPVSGDAGKTLLWSALLAGCGLALGNLLALARIRFALTLVAGILLAVVLQRYVGRTAASYGAWFLTGLASGCWRCSGRRKTWRRQIRPRPRPPQPWSAIWAAR